MGNCQGLCVTDKQINGDGKVSQENVQRALADNQAMGVGQPQGLKDQKPGDRYAEEQANEGGNEIGYNRLLGGHMNLMPRNMP